METPVPLHYRLCIEPDLVTFRFDGTLHLTVALLVPTAEIVLDAVELSVVSCRLDGDATCAFSVDPEGETLHISLPRPMTGEILLEIIYTGVINDRMEGFYRGRYSKDGEDRYLAVTQFEESSARMALPCFDHPARKTTFDVILVVDRDLSVFSNGDILKETAEKNGKKRVVFETTPKMSTYLLFFGVGEFELVIDGIDKRVRAACVPGSGHLLGMSLEVARHSLAFCEEYFGIPYPMTKLDHIAVPDFAFGAMENWGAVVFRENLLLYDPAKTSQAGKERICEVVAHEIVHQWFGNLVTPIDWKYLWLNESFATFFANRILDRIQPDWQVWDQFLHTTISVAMVRDALQNTLAIEIPGGEHVVINAATAPIIYNKGGGVLLQMVGYLGEEAFRKGLAHYLKAHAYGSTQSHHLWDAYGAVTEKPVAAMMQAWVSQPGFPLVTVTRNGDTLAFSQMRFSYLETESDSRQLWPIPLNIALFSDAGEETRFDILLDKPEAMLHLPPGAKAIKINAGQSGFYRVHYASEEMLAALGSLVSEKKLSPADRWGLQEDLFSLVRAGKAPLARYLDFIGAYGEEEDFLPAMGITGNLHLAYLISEGSLRARVAAAGKAFLEGVLHRIGYLPDEAESNTTRMLRDAVLFRAVLFGSEAVLAWGEEHFRNLMGGREVHPDIQRSILQIGARAMPDVAFPWLRDRFRKSQSEHERMNLLSAMGALSKEEMLREAFTFALDEVPQRNRHLPMAAAAANPEAIGFMWDWITARMADLEQLHPLLFERVMDALVPLCGLGREAAVKTFFDEYLLRAKTGEATLRIALEFLEVNGNVRRGGV